MTSEAKTRIATDIELKRLESAIRRGERPAIPYTDQELLALVGPKDFIGARAKLVNALLAARGSTVRFVGSRSRHILCFG